MQEERGQDHIWRYFNSRLESMLQKRGEKIGWICSYTPVEILAAAGFRPGRLYGEGRQGFLADSYLQSNLCSYARSLLEWGLERSQELSGLVVANSCNAMAHLFHNWERYCPLPFCYCLDLPRTRGRGAVYYFKQSLRRLVRALEELRDCSIDRTVLWDQIELYRTLRTLGGRLLSPPGEEKFSKGMAINIGRCLMQLPSEDAVTLIEEIEREAEKVAPPRRKGPRVFLAGGMTKGDIAFRIEECGGVIVGDDLCTGSRYYRGFPSGEESEICSEGDPLEFLAGYYLSRCPCARMKSDVDWTGEMVHRVRETGAQGVVFCAVKFCDPWHYEGQMAKQALEERGIPVLMLEEEYGSGGGGQLLTRIQAFLEMIAR